MAERLDFCGNPERFHIERQLCAAAPWPKSPYEARYAWANVMVMDCCGPESRGYLRISAEEAGLLDDGYGSPPPLGDSSAGQVFVSGNAVLR